MGISNNISNAYSSNTIFSCLRSGSRPSYKTPIPSLQIAIQEGLTGEENVKLRLQELEALNEKRRGPTTP